MRKLLVSVAVAAAALASVPAAAQYQGSGWGQAERHDGRWNHRGPDRRAVGQLMRDLDQIESRIDRSARRGLISPREAFGLRRDANRIRDRIHRASRNGLSGREYADLRGQLNRLEQRLRAERRDRDGRRG